MAYGKVRGIEKPFGDLPARIYPIQTDFFEPRTAILTVPFDFAAGDELDAHLVQKLHEDFRDEVEHGRTFPQEDVLDLEEYTGYFLSHDLVVGFFLTRTQLQSLPTSYQDIPTTGIPLDPALLPQIKIGESKLHIRSYQSGRPSSLPDPSDTYAFAYYIKPNYPGRSSHLCNGGFLVPPAYRGLGLGRIAARSFLFYAPACGYTGSVFNLVYANNEASIRLWERLGFQNVGRIPEAGRLRMEGRGGDEEEFVDAWVVYGDFRKIGFYDAL